MDFKGKICPICSKKFENDDDIVVCPKCGAPYHRDCYSVEGKCIFPDLHRSKQSWKEVYDKSENNAPDNNDDKNKNTVICPICGEENPRSYLLCGRCGNMLKQGVRIHIDNDNDNDDNSVEEKLKELSEGNPFMFLVDPMGGVKKNEDFDGVNGAELAKFVRANTTYYMPVFQRIKNTARSRFNFPAFFFTGAWYLYRKQYIRGAVISLLYFALVIARYLVTMNYSLPILNDIRSLLIESGLSNPDSRDIMSWALENSSQNDLSIIMLPYLISAVIFIFSLICGFTANKSYYKHSIRKIKQIKEQHDGEGLMKTIGEKGGVNTLLAWSIMVCYIISIIAF